MITTRRSGVAAALAATAIVLGATGPAVAAPGAARAGGQVRFFVDLDVKSQTTQPTLFTGAIGDYGTSTSLNGKGKVDPNGNFEKEKLQHGTFTINATALNAALAKAHGVVNKSTCTVSITGTAATTLYGGTGLYKGISGKLKITLSYAALFPRLANGRCNFGDNAQPVSQFGQVYGAGTVHFG